MDWLNWIPYLSYLLFTVLVVFYLERKISAFVQDRMGPMVVGKFGLLQPFADLFKLLQKEQIVNRKAEKWLFLAAPLLLFIVVFSAFSLVPLTAFSTPASVPTGVLFITALLSIDVLGILMAGWASGSKFSILGAMRAIGQIVSYEVPITLMVLTCVLYYGTADLGEMVQKQGAAATPAWLQHLGIQGGMFGWGIFQFPVFLPLLICFFIASLAESNRAPFDLPEGESEIIGGFHTEYSGFRWALFFLSEYAMMVILSLLSVHFFLGGWHSIWPDFKAASGQESINPIFGLIWVWAKTLLLLVLMIWVRWTFPRLRVDQVMFICWKVLLPFCLLIFVFTLFWKWAV
jgi:NADH-quinone oxidoreductase subunit H